MTRKCPKCRRDLDEIKYFQPPMKICLVCYAMFPDNHGLSLLALRAKAMASRNIKFYHKRRDYQAQRHAFDELIENSEVVIPNTYISDPEMVPALSCEGLGMSCEAENAWPPGMTPTRMYRLFGGKRESTPTFTCPSCAKWLEGIGEAKREE